MRCTTFVLSMWRDQITVESIKKLFRYPNPFEIPGVASWSDAIFGFIDDKENFLITKTLAILQLWTKSELGLYRVQKPLRNTNSSDHVRVWTANLLQTIQLSNPLNHEGIRQFEPSRGHWSLGSLINLKYVKQKNMLS